LAGVRIPDIAEWSAIKQARHDSMSGLHDPPNLCSDAFLARSQPNWEGILLHGSTNYHKNLGVDESVAWGIISLSKHW